MRYLLIILLFIGANRVAGQEKLPNTYVTNTKGEEVNILEQIDKLTIIDFWATWCKPCIAQMPDLDRIKRKYKRKIEIISISIDNDIEKWAQFVSSTKNQKHHYVIDDANPLMQYITISMQEYGFAGTTTQIPVIILVNKNGEIINNNCPNPASGRFTDLLKDHL